MIKTKKQSLIIVGAFVIALMLFTTTYAFFNYTRTGSANTIKTGRIAFDATQGNDTVTLSDLFPITVGPNDVITPSTPGVGSLTIHVTGDTTYAEGIEYLVKAVNVTETNGTSLPISVVITYEANGQENTIGTPNDNYFNVRGGSTSYYKVLSADTISNNGDLIVGYIAPGQTGIDGNITIMAYLDASNIAITDTYPQGTVRNVLATGYTSAACETALTGVNDASTYCASVEALQEAIDNEDLTDEEIRLLVVAGIVEEYTDGTTSEWVNQRTVFTTEEWNALQANGVSFQIRTEANEGTWVINPGSSNLSLSPASGQIDLNSATTTTSTITTNGDGAITCASSDDTVATCSIENGTLTVTGVAVGNATITVTEAAGTKFATPATATFDVEVIS